MPVVAVVIVFGYRLCDLAFTCGCSHIWQGGVETCNVKLSGVPHCPWCEHPWLGTVSFLFAIGLALGAFYWASRRGGSGWRASVVALVAFLPALVLAAGVTWLATDYPHWLARDARRTLSVPAGPIMCGPARVPGEAAAEPRLP